MPGKNYKEGNRKSFRREKIKPFRSLRQKTIFQNKMMNPQEVAKQWSNPRITQSMRCSLHKILEYRTIH